MTTDPFTPIAGGSKRATTAIPPKGTVVLPVPADAPPAPTEHPTLGAPTITWCYRGAASVVLGFACRFDSDAGKQFRPLTLWRDTRDGSLRWRWESWPPQRPLYGLHGLAQRPSAPVVVCEGEKAADAAAQLLPGFVAVTSPNGSKSAGKANWLPLRGRAVTVWPDADAAGLAYATTVTKLVIKAGAASVAISSPPQGVSVGWDAADALKEGWATERATELLAAAVPADKITTNKSTATEGVEKPIGDDGATGGRRRVPQRDVLIGLTEYVELWHDANRTAYASFAINNHQEHWPVKSRDFRMWLSGRFYEKTGAAIGGQALEDGVRILEARAVNEGPEYEPFIRVGRHDGNLYLDLCDAAWRAVEIGAEGWRVIEKPPLKLLRSPSMRPLPEPEAGTMIEVLRRFFINLRSNNDFVLTLAWLIAALREVGPYPVLVINGEQGSGKSVFCRMLRLLIDPSAAPIRAVPKDDHNLFLSAGNSWILAYDNLSSMQAWLSDALCSLATTGGYATRTLHTDRDETVFEFMRPLVLNGISSLTDRADLASRAVTIHLKAIPEEECAPEDELWADFKETQPKILGALLDGVSAALRNIASVKLDRFPRMADFCKWVVAAEPGLGLEPGTFIAAYSENRLAVTEASFEADAVAVAIWKLLTVKMVDGFTGTATALLDEINNYVSEGTRKSKYWPQGATQLGNRVVRAAPLLKAKGCTVERRHSGERIIMIVPPKNTI